MSAITPQTNLKLLKCPIESDNRNQLTFNDSTTQYNYFNSLPSLEVENFTYQRKDSVIRYPAHIDTILEYNYVMYQNEAYSNKWFYAFISNMEYVNDNMTLITIKTDVYQTWQLNMIWFKSFIEREHVNDDSIGANIVPEDLETGDYEIYGSYKDPNLSNVANVGFILATTLDLNSLSDNPIPQNGGGIYNGMYSGCRYYSFTRQSYTNIKNILQLVASRGQIDQILGLFVAPLFLDSSSGSEVTQSFTPSTYTININPTYKSVYTKARNNKLYTYPYCYLGVTNGAGSSNIYKYEYFDHSQTNTCDFEVRGALAPGCSIRLTPMYYNNTGGLYNEQESLSLGKYPICSYNVDMYTNWLTQNSINILGKTVSTDTLNMGANIFNAIGGTIANVKTGNIGGAVSNAANSALGIANAMITKKQHELMGSSVQGDVNNGDVVTASNCNTFTFYNMCIKYEAAKKIDDYFSMYGYQINEVKLPNITGRLNWNYVKTIGANIQGDIPENDLNEIKSLFNNGITLWHNPSTYLDYSQNNNII